MNKFIGSINGQPDIKIFLPEVVSLESAEIQKLLGNVYRSKTKLWVPCELRISTDFHWERNESSELITITAGIVEEIMSTGHVLLRRFDGDMRKCSIINTSRISEIPNGDIREQSKWDYEDLSMKLPDTL